jgi:hypothetical protein
VNAFIVQERIHADALSRHENREDAVAAVEELTHEGLADPGDFNIREIDDAGKTVGVFDIPGTHTPSTDAA